MALYNFILAHIWIVNAAVSTVGFLTMMLMLLLAKRWGDERRAEIAKQRAKAPLRIRHHIPIPVLERSEK
jgi:hypothetical protein